MTILIITSSYPAKPDDATSAAGLFVRDFALQLSRSGHTVIVFTPARKELYYDEPGIKIESIPWKGGDQELASMSFTNPGNWKVLLHFFWMGCKVVVDAVHSNNAGRILCMWTVPAGIFGWWAKRKTGIPYDVWALGSDIWRIRRLPFGRNILKSILKNADRAFADGITLSHDVEQIAGRQCEFLPSSRILPPAETDFPELQPAVCKHLLYVGRYHPNKGPDILLAALSTLKEDEREKIRVHMFGYGTMKRELVAAILRNHLEKFVHLHDTINAQELSNYLSRVDYLLIPSRIESIPVVLSDAAQRNTPVIVSDAGDMGTLVKDFHAGMVFAANNSIALAECMRRAITQDRAMFLPGIQQLSQKFDIHQASDHWLSSIRK